MQLIEMLDTNEDDEVDSFEWTTMLSQVNTDNVVSLGADRFLILRIKYCTCGLGARTDTMHYVLPRPESLAHILLVSWLAPTTLLEWFPRGNKNWNKKGKLRSLSLESWSSVTDNNSLSTCTTTCTHPDDNIAHSSSVSVADVKCRHRAKSL